MTPTDLSMPLRDAIDIPEVVHVDDFVLQIHSAQQAAEKTLNDYVVTDAIAEAVDDGLNMVEGAVATGTSKGAFVHGSFGAGKSHYMAVLHLLLTGNTHARTLPGLQDVVAGRSALLERKFLAVDYHFVGAESVESALFGGYLKTVKEKHPDAVAPVLHRSEALLENADQLRKELGDEAFFAKLGGGSGGGWAKFAGGGITPDAYAPARSAAPGDSARQNLVTQLVKHYFSGFETTGTWLDMSSGLEAMANHAKGLGYEGIVLFLDELVLWLSAHLGDSTFISTETSKIAKLVETGNARLALPLVSFVARQRNLKDFVGESHGAEKVALDDSFQWWEGRFAKITLPAADLPQIVQRRLLAPSGEAGKAAITKAIAKVRANPKAYNHLLTDEAGSDALDFEMVYPFSPALVDAMIALSAIMQRERTALKIMSELLANGRGELTVGDVIGVGDLFDAVVLGDSEPLSSDMKSLFKAAKTFYEQKMRPYLLNRHGLSEAKARGLERTQPFRRDDRIAKTLLIAAIAPGATSLKDMTASKLAALNFGSVVSMLPGQEAAQVVTKVKEWSGEFGEITVGHQAGDPVISLQLSGIDLDSVLVHVQMEDNAPNRRRLIRELLVEQIGAVRTGAIGSEYSLTHVWRGQKRDVDVIFGNIRDDKTMPESALQASDGRWRLIIDYPFDEGNHEPTDDVARLRQLREGGMDTDSIAWLAHFISVARLEDVGKLVTLDYLLTGNRFDQHSGSLPVAEREPARRQLTNQRDSLREQVLASLRQAYGIDAAPEDQMGARVPDGRMFIALARDYDPLKPAAPNFQGAVTGVLGGALEARYPKHPKIDRDGDEVRRSELTAVLDLARRAMAAGSRIEGLDRPTANKVRRVVDAYGVGKLTETTYVLQPQFFRWHDDFTKAAVPGDVSVRDLRASIADFGLTSDVADLLVLAWAAMTDRVLKRYGGRLSEPGIGTLAPEVTLHEPMLPHAEEWTEARDRAKALFGVGASEFHLSSASLERLSTAIGGETKGRQADVDALVRRLEEHAAALGLSDVSPRLASARRARDLVSSLNRADGALERIRVLAEFDLPSELPALATSLASAGEVQAALAGANWQLINQLTSLGGDEANVAVRDLRKVAGAEELHAKLRPALSEAASRVTSILVERNPKPSGPSADELAAARRAEEERRLAEEERRLAEEERARELAEQHRRLAEEQARVHREQQELDRQRREAEERARLTKSEYIEQASELETLLRAFVEELSNPVPGKKLRVSWRWED